MRTKCGVEHETWIERPPSARFALWYLGHIKFFATREEAERAFTGLAPSDREEATVGELERQRPQER